MVHNNPSVAVVSRNYNEMRERLLQLLSKKRDKKCKTEKCSSANVPAQRSILALNTEQKMVPEQMNNRLNCEQNMADVDDLLNFIEGKHSIKKNDKKAEKKARQKQKKFEEKLKKEREETEREKLMELRKKTPEVTITVVDPQKPVLQRHSHNRHLPEVSILPASTPVVLTPIVQQNSRQQPAVTNSDGSTKEKHKSRKVKEKQKQMKNQKQKNKKSKQLTTREEEEEEEEKEEEQTATSSLLQRFKTLDPTDPRLTKKERKKLRRELRKLEAATQPEEKPTQIVTIRRVMEANSAEPTVTITLKGQTPAEDKVLYTLVNGQTKTPEVQGKKKKKKSAKIEEVPVAIPVQTTCATCSAKQLLEKRQQGSVNASQKNANKNEQLKDKIAETKSSKKKNKKDVENKENVVQSNSNVAKSKHEQKQQMNQKQKNQNQKQNKNQMVNVTQQQKSGKKNKNLQETQKPKQELPKIQNKMHPKLTPMHEVHERKDNYMHSAPLSSQVTDFSGAKIDIENLKLPPGITITKVDVPTKSIPIKSTPMPNPKSAPKQTAIITAMGGPATGFGGAQNGSNVIVVDTGKLKQDLIPKPSDKDGSHDMETQPGSASKKKKKKKKKKGLSSLTPSEQDCVNYDQSARILHNPATNMVTIRNPAFGPPKIEPPQQPPQQQQAAIIKVSENGMVTIRSPALQHAINAGMTPPPKPDFIVKGELAKSVQRNGLVDLANIQISKVANGHPIPENGINLRGTSVTLTKVKSEEAESASATTSATKLKKKKKRTGVGVLSRGDDWNLVESVFTPKDIDLEDGEMDDAERELEAFKRFCLQSVPPPRKEKVNLNIKDIVLKKKAAAVIAAN